MVLRLPQRPKHHERRLKLIFFRKSLETEPLDYIMAGVYERLECAYLTFHPLCLKRLRWRESRDGLIQKAEKLALCASNLLSYNNLILACSVFRKDMQDGFSR